MKIAVTSTGQTLSDPIDPRFGRAAFFILVDADTKERGFGRHPFVADRFRGEFDRGDRAPAPPGNGRRSWLLPSDASRGGEITAQTVGKLGDVVATTPFVDQYRNRALSPGNLLFQVGNGRAQESHSRLVDNLLC